MRERLLTEVQRIEVSVALRNGEQRIARQRAQVDAAAVRHYSVGDLLDLIDDLQRMQIRIAALATRIVDPPPV